MSKPVGGRGKKAPYQTAVVRVPVELIPLIERLCEVYRDGIERGINLGTGNDLLLINKAQLEEQALILLKRKKSARATLDNLLQVIFSDLGLRLDTFINQS